MYVAAAAEHAGAERVEHGEWQAQREVHEVGAGVATDVVAPSQPVRKVVADAEEVYTEAGIPAEWVAVVQKMGYITLEAFKNTASTGGMKLFNDLCGFNKKNKLGLATAEIKAWIEAQAQ